MKDLEGGREKSGREASWKRDDVISKWRWRVFHIVVVVTIHGGVKHDWMTQACHWMWELRGGGMDTSLVKERGGERGASPAS